MPSLSSVSGWARLRSSGQGRLRGPVGGLSLRSASKSRVRLFTKLLQGRKAKVKKVLFTLDGKRLGLDRRAPFTADFNPSQLKQGAHVLRARVTQKGKAKTLKYTTYVAECHPTKFSAAMSTKKRRARPNLKFTVQTFGPELGSARFFLPIALQAKALAKARGKSVGTLRLTRTNGKTSAFPLRLPKQGRAAAMVTSQGTHLLIKPGRKSEISLVGLPSNVTKISLKLLAKRTNLMVNPARCSSLRYRAALTDSLHTSLTFTSAARVC